MQQRKQKEAGSKYILCRPHMRDSPGTPQGINRSVSRSAATLGTSLEGWGPSREPTQPRRQTVGAPAESVTSESSHPVSAKRKRAARKSNVACIACIKCRIQLASRLDTPACTRQEITQSAVAASSPHRVQQHLVSYVRSTQNHEPRNDWTLSTWNMQHRQTQTLKALVALSASAPNAHRPALRCRQSAPARYCRRPESETQQD